MASYDWYSLSASQKLYKVVYDEEKMRSVIADLLGFEKLFSQCKDAPKKDAGGQYFTGEVITRYPSSVTMTPVSGGATPTPDVGDFANYKVYMRHLVATNAIEESAMALGETDEQAYGNVLEMSKELILKAIKRRWICQYLGGHDGTAARLVSASTVTLTVNGGLGYKKGDNTTYNAHAAELFQPGDRIIVDREGVPVYTTVVSTNPAAGTIVVVNSCAGHALCSIVFGESATVSDYNNSVDGFRDLFGTGPYQTIDPDVVPQWKAQQYAGFTPGTDESFTDKHINRLVGGSAQSEDIDTVVGHVNMVQAFSDYFSGQVKYDPLQYTGGVRLVKWVWQNRTLNLFTDFAAPHNMLLGMPVKEVIKYTAKPGGWMARDGADFKWVAGTTGYIQVWSEIKNLGTKARNKFAVQYDIEEPWA